MREIPRIRVNLTFARNSKITAIKIKTSYKKTEQTARKDSNKKTQTTIQKLNSKT